MSEDKQIIVRQFDPETGELDERVLAALTDSQIEEIIEDGQAVFTMTQTKGWKIIHESLLTSIELIKEKIVDLNDFEEIKRYQNMVRVYSNVLGMVQQQIAAGEQLSQLKNPTGA